MRKIAIVVLVFISSALFAAGPLTFKVYDNIVKVTIELEDGEHIVDSDQFLNLYVDSDEYDFIFSGYPESEPQDNGLSYYSNSLTLEGELILKEGINEGDYDIEVTFEYQTCTDEGICNFPVSVTEKLSVKTTKFSYLYIVLPIVLIFIIIILIKIKRKNA